MSFPTSYYVHYSFQITNLLLAQGYTKKEIWVLDTVGSNLLGLLASDNIDIYKTITNDIPEIKNVLGIEAARQAIFAELSEVLEFDSTYINYHHLSVLCDRMTCSDKMTSVFRHGINADDIGPLAKASFEETPEMFIKAARHGELDEMRGVSANVMCGQSGYFGTSTFQVNIDSSALLSLEDTPESEEISIEKEFKELTNPDDPCSSNNILTHTNMQNINAEDIGTNNNYDPFA